MSFNLIVLALLTGLLIYTGFTLSIDGIDFLSVAARDLSAMGWSGQFIVDFSCYLVLSALWVAWRHRYSAAGLLLALLALVGGFFFFGFYLLYVGIRARGDMQALLLGDRVVAARAR